jgi:hypothetical protein
MDKLADELDEERLLLEAAVAEARADPREVPHEDVAAWLMRIKAGEFDAAPPITRILWGVSGLKTRCATWFT